MHGLWELDAMASTGTAIPALDNTVSLITTFQSLDFLPPTDVYWIVRMSFHNRYVSESWLPLTAHADNFPSE